MHQPLRPYSLVPGGFVVVMTVHDTAMTTITVRSSKDSGICPSCGTVSSRVHSREPLHFANHRPQQVTAASAGEPKGISRFPTRAGSERHRLSHCGRQQSLGKKAAGEASEGTEDAQGRAGRAVLGAAQ
jgi:hypothetical protein